MNTRFLALVVLIALVLIWLILTHQPALIAWGHRFFHFWGL